MDIDAIVERNGHFLIFETKAPDKEIPLGQRITLRRLCKLGRGRIRIIILYGKSAKTIARIEEWSYLNGAVVVQPCKCNAHYVLQIVSAWFQKVNNFAGGINK